MKPSRAKPSRAKPSRAKPSRAKPSRPKPSRVDRAFERYRANGSPRALAAVFDATAPELYRLAWYLVGDSHAAEDLVQTTFLVAMERSAAFEPGREVMPWLCGILANRAREVRRRRRRLRQRARETSEPVADPAEEAAARELEQAMQERVRSLPEPYRHVLILHLEHGLGASEIAEAHDRPAATVRSQIQRGLEMVRRALPVGFVAGLAAFAPAAGLGAVRRTVLAHATGSMTATVAVVGGAIAMKKIVLLSVVAAAALLFAWPFVLPSEDRAAAEPENPRQVRQGSAAADGLRNDQDGARQELPTKGTVEGSIRLRVTVRWQKDRQPANDVVVRWFPMRADAQLVERLVRTDSAGVARFEGLLPGRAEIRVDLGAKAKVKLGAGSQEEIEILIPEGVLVRGRVVDLQNRPIPNAGIWMSTAVYWLDEGSIVAHADASGQFVIRSIPPGRTLSALAAGYAPGGGWPIARDAKGPVHVTLKLRAASGSMHGVVYDPQAQPVANAPVLVGLFYGEQVAIGSPARFVRTDAQGRFRIVGLWPGHWPVWIRASGCALWREHVAVDAKAPTPLQVHLRRGATITGQVLDEAGAPVSHARILGYYDKVEPRPNMAWQGPYWAREHARSDAEGRYRLENVMPGRFKLRVERGARNAVRNFEIVNESRLLWNPILRQPLAILGVVTDTQRRPLAGWKVGGAGGKGVRHLRTVVTDAAGRFELKGAEDAGYELTFGMNVSGMHGAALWLENVRPNREPLQVQIPAHRIPTARLHGVVLGADGTRLQRFRVSLTRMGEDGTLQYAGSQVEQAVHGFRTGLLIPGRYYVRVYSKEEGQLRLGEWSVTPNATVDVGTHRFDPQSGSLQVEVVDSDGARITFAGLMIRKHGDPHWLSLSMKDGVGGATRMQPGRYTLSTCHRQITMLAREIEIRAGATEKVRFQVARGVPCQLRFPPIPRRNYTLRQTWRSESGAVVFDGGGGVWDRPTLRTTMDRRILPGRYTVEIRDASRMTKVQIEVKRQDELQIFDLPLPGAR